MLIEKSFMGKTRKSFHYESRGPIFAGHNTWSVWPFFFPFLHSDELSKGILNGVSSDVFEKRLWMLQPTNSFVSQFNVHVLCSVSFGKLSSKVEPFTLKNFQLQVRLESDILSLDIQRNSGRNFEFGARPESTCGKNYFSIEKIWGLLSTKKKKKLFNCNIRVERFSQKLTEFKLALKNQKFKPA